jgi:hypothetical protein
VTLEDPAWLARDQISQWDGIVLRRPGKQLAVGGESCQVDTAGEAILWVLPASCDWVPETGRTFVRRRNELLAVGGACHPGAIGEGREGFQDTVHLACYRFPLTNAGFRILAVGLTLIVQYIHMDP